MNASPDWAIGKDPAEPLHAIDRSGSLLLFSCGGERGDGASAFGNRDDFTRLSPFQDGGKVVRQIGDARGLHGRKICHAEICVNAMLVGYLHRDEF